MNNICTFAYACSTNVLVNKDNTGRYVLHGWNLYFHNNESPHCGTINWTHEDHFWAVSWFRRIFCSFLVVAISRHRTALKPCTLLACRVLRKCFLQAAVRACTNYKSRANMDLAYMYVKSLLKSCACYIFYPFVPFEIFSVASFFVNSILSKLKR